MTNTASKTMATTMTSARWGLYAGNKLIAEGTAADRTLAERAVVDAADRYLPPMPAGLSVDSATGLRFVIGRRADLRCLIAVGDHDADELRVRDLRSWR